jgi:hypothetical protein
VNCEQKTVNCVLLEDLRIGSSRNLASVHRSAFTVTLRVWDEAMKMTNKLFVALVLAALAAGLAQAQTAKPRYVHEPDLRQMLPKFLTPQGFLDPKFAEATSQPSPYLTDFYGLQALADTTKEGIKRDFVPKFAEVAGEDENTITLKFKAGYTAKFYPHSAIKAAGQLIPRDHVAISGATWPELLKNLADFRGLITANKLAKRYLLPNPFYREELVVARQLAKNPTPAQPVASPSLAEFQAARNALLMYPEGVHGNVKGYEKFKADVLDKQQFDWIGLEMLTPSQQKDLDAYVKSPDGSPAYTRARQALLDYFKDAWNGRAGPKTSAEENYYFKIVEQMRARKTRIIGVEASTLEYIFFRYGENKFGGAVRSLQWANALPKTGKGLIFGGSGHFTDPAPINFQDLQQMVNPKMKLFVLEPFKMRQAAN